ncbi:MAG: hypothetical protein HQM02_14010 [Magnetococcales bacterium]|nr:hypothetical protein [Magnetococcales bacterium]
MMTRMVGMEGVVLVLLCLVSAPVWAQNDPLQRKAELVDQLLKDSETSRRISKQGDDASRALLDQARKAREEARQAIQAGDVNKGAAGLDQALKLVTRASRTTMDPAGRQWLHRARFEDLQVSVQNFKEAYARHLQRLRAGEKGPLDVGAVDALQSQADALGKEKQFLEANKILERAHESVVKGLKSLLGSTALVYELKFDTPKDEYEYEIKKGESFEAMIRMVLAERSAQSTDETQIRPLMDQSQEANSRAAQQAAAGRFKEAIRLQEEANGFLARVLRALGVMIPL